jgi:hypothetical protein
LQQQILGTIKLVVKSGGIDISQLQWNSIRFEVAHFSKRNHEISNSLILPTKQLGKNKVSKWIKLYLRKKNLYSNHLMWNQMRISST